MSSRRSVGGAAVPAAARVRPVAGSTSSRTTTPSAVGSTQRSRPAACFLSVARWPRTVVERVGQRLGRQPERVEQPLDPLRPLRRRHAERDADPGRGAQPVGHRLAVEQPAVPGRRLERVAQRVARGSA